MTNSSPGTTRTSTYRTVLTTLSIILVLALVVSLFDRSRENFKRQHAETRSEDYKIVDYDENENNDNLEPKTPIIKRQVASVSRMIPDGSMPGELGGLETGQDSNYLDFISPEALQEHKNKLIDDMISNGADNDEVMEIIEAVDRSIEESQTKNEVSIEEQNINNNNRYFIKNSVSSFFSNSKRLPASYWIHTKIRLTPNMIDLENGSFNFDIFRVHQQNKEENLESLSLNNDGITYTTRSMLPGVTQKTIFPKSILHQINSGKMHYLSMYVFESKVELYVDCRRVFVETVQPKADLPANFNDLVIESQIRKGKALPVQVTKFNIFDASNLVAINRNGMCCENTKKNRCIIEATINGQSTNDFENKNNLVKPTEAASVAGPRGPMGLPGRDGERGPMGPRGFDGRDGAKLEEIRDMVESLIDKRIEKIIKEVKDSCRQSCGASQRLGMNRLNRRQLSVSASGFERLPRVLGKKWREQRLIIDY